MYQTIAWGGGGDHGSVSLKKYKCLHSTHTNIAKYSISAVIINLKLFKMTLSSTRGVAVISTEISVAARSVASWENIET